MLKKNVKLVFALAIIGFLGISSQAFSQNYQYFDNWTNDAGMQWWNNGIPSRYALSADQIAKVNDIRAKSSKKIQPLQDKLYSLRGKLQRYNGSDVQEIRSYRNEISRLENKISDINLATRVQVRKVLGTDQLTYFNNGGYGWWDRAGDCWYSPNTTDYGTRRNRMWRHYGYDGCWRW